jgi:hypothetical protein
MRFLLALHRKPANMRLMKQEAKMCKIFDSSRFTISRMPDGVSLIAEASDFNRELPDGFDYGIAVRSIRTGRVVRYALTKIERDREGDILAWKLDPVAEDRKLAAGARVVILND